MSNQEKVISALALCGALLFMFMFGFTLPRNVQIIEQPDTYEVSSSEFKEHSYVIFEKPFSSIVVHDPDCSKCNETFTKETIK